jgi:hypothetical protein
MEHQFEYEFHDIYPALKNQLRVGGYWLSFIGICLIIAALPSSGYGLIVFGIFLAIFGFLFPYYQSFLAFKKAKKICGVITVELNDSGITLKDNTGTRNIYWDVFKSVFSDKNHLFLVEESKSVCVIPKRAFSEKEWIDIEKLVSQKIK